MHGRESVLFKHTILKLDLHMEFTYLVSSRGPGVAGEGESNRFGSVSSLPRRSLLFTLPTPPADIVSSPRSSKHNVGTLRTVCMDGA